MILRWNARRRHCQTCVPLASLLKSFACALQRP